MPARRITDWTSSFHLVATGLVASSAGDFRESVRPRSQPSGEVRFSIGQFATSSKLVKY
jgi:hypothetical protein